MERNVMGELNMYRQLGMTPNFTEIGRKYGLHRRTVAKYWKQGEEIEDRRRDRPSAFDEFRDAIERKAALPGVTKKAVCEFLIHRHPDAGLPKHGSFTKHCRDRGIECAASGAPDAHPRFETPPGRQPQFDWKEDLRLVDVNGEVFEFNVFSAVLGYSRAHRFVYSRTRTEDDLLACLLATFTRFGGVPEEAVADNMSAPVAFSGGKRRRSERARRFAREAGFELKLCRVAAPQTKGKGESANRFVNRLLAYDRDFEGERGLREAIARIEARANSEPNETTGLPPAALFMREKEHLRPIGNLRLLQEMVGDVSVQTVPPTMLVRAAGRQWSVPRARIGKKVNVISMPSGQVRVTMGGEEAAARGADAGAGPIVHSEERYAEALEGKSWFRDADIREAARANLALLDRLGGGPDEGGR